MALSAADVAEWGVRGVVPRPKAIAVRLPGAAAIAKMPHLKALNVVGSTSDLHVDPAHAPAPAPAASAAASALVAAALAATSKDAKAMSEAVLSASAATSTSSPASSASSATAAAAMVDSKTPSPATSTATPNGANVAPSFSVPASSLSFAVAPNRGLALHSVGLELARVAASPALQRAESDLRERLAQNQRVIDFDAVVRAHDSSASAKRKATVVGDVFQKRSAIALPEGVEVLHGKVAFGSEQVLQSGATAPVPAAAGANVQAAAAKPNSVHHLILTPGAHIRITGLVGRYMPPNRPQDDLRDPAEYEGESHHVNSYTVQMDVKVKPFGVEAVPLLHPIHDNDMDVFDEQWTLASRLRRLGSLGIGNDYSGAFTFNEWQRVVIVRDMVTDPLTLQTGTLFYLDGKRVNVVADAAQHHAFDSLYSIGKGGIDLFAVDPETKRAVTGANAKQQALSLPTILVRVSVVH